MVYLLLRWLINSLLLILISNFLPGFHIDGFYAALIAALIISILNTLVRPFLIILTLPINILTLGIFTFFINAIIISLASTIVKGFNVDTFAAAFTAGLIIWVVNYLINSLGKNDNNQYIKRVK